MLTATIDWGDGTAPETVALVGGRVEASRGFATAGVYDVTITLEDGDGGQRRREPARHRH